MNRKIIIALCALCLCVFCSCSKNEEQNNSSEKPTETTAVTTVSTTTTTPTTSELVADTPPPYMYYEGDLYIPAVNPEDRLIFDTAELKDYKYVGKTTQCSDCSGLTENFRVTILRDNAKVYYDQNEPLDGKPFALMSINENGTVWIAYLKLNDRD